MADFVYCVVPGKIASLLSKIRTAGIPQKMSYAYLKTLGFTSSNDQGLVSVLRYIGFTDASNIPTQLWSEYRGANHRRVLASAIKRGYAELFAVYPDANSRSNEELGNVFRTSSSAGAQVISKTVTTFKALVDEADFSGTEETVETSLQAGPLHTPPAEKPGPPTQRSKPEVHIDVQIHISPESSNEQIEKIFESMAKHLYGNEPS